MYAIIIGVSCRSLHGLSFPVNMSMMNGKEISTTSQVVCVMDDATSPLLYPPLLLCLIGWSVGPENRLIWSLRDLDHLVSCDSG
jgi:hypothetical protein